VLKIRVEGGEIVGPAAGWVYAWSEEGVGAPSVIYVGATRLHPAARAEKHLRDPDPRVGRLRARYPAAGGDLRSPLVLCAVEVPSGGRRDLVKAMVAWLLQRAGRLSPRYCGDAPAPPAEPPDAGEERCARDLVAFLP